MQLHNLTVAVIGGAGFIGSHLVDQLADQRRGNQIIVFDNFSTGTPDNVKGSGARVIRGDVRNLKALEEALGGVDVVFHLAAHCVRLSLVDPVTNHDVNATGTLNALMAARQNGVKRFIYCSSSEVYGNAVDSLGGSQGGLLGEGSPKIPTTIYGASKLLGENYTLAYHQTYDLPGTVVRPFNTYGPRSHVFGPYGEVIPRFTVLVKAGQPPTVFGDGRQTRDFTYVEDTAVGLIACAESDALLGDSVNLAHGEEVSVLQIANMICEIVGTEITPKHLPDRPGDIRRLGADVRKLRSLIRVEAPTPIREGLARYVRWLDSCALDYADVARRLTEKNWIESPESGLDPLYN